MTIKNIFNRFSKRAKVITVATLAVLALGVPAAVMAGYGPNGPDRKIFDFTDPVEREGAFDGPRFNSYINTNVYGDERAFLDAKECVVPGNECYNQGTAGNFKDQQPVTADREYIVRAYVHNIANDKINDDPTTAAPFDGIGVAKNTRIRFELPEGIANGFTAQARISADNALPQMVYDTVDFKNPDQKVDIDFIPGSARIFNAAHPNGLALSDDIMGPNGTQIGHDVMDGGIYPGCFPYTSFVVIRVVVKAPKLEVAKTVSKVDMPKLTDVSESITVKRGDTVSWRIDYKNTGTAFVDDVAIRDQLPAGLTLVPGSIKLTTAAGQETLSDTALGGVNVGDYTPNGNGVIRFRTVVNTAEDVCQVTNVAFGRASDIAERSDDAKIVIENCKTTTPIYSCDLVKLETIGTRKVKATVSTTAQPANRVSLKLVNYDFGDGTKVTTDKTVLEHQYAKDGTYVVTAKVTFEVDGKLVEHTGNCTAKVAFTTPGTSSTLPNTGAGDVVGIFVAVTVVGYAVATRRFAR